MTELYLKTAIVMIIYYSYKLIKNCRNIGNKTGKIGIGKAVKSIPRYNKKVMLLLNFITN